MHLAPALLLLVVLASPAAAQDPAPSPEIRRLAVEIAGDSGPPVERTRRLTAWINTQFRWTATDYERRTVDEIIQRRGGNCAELARVLMRLLDAAEIPHRMVREINIHPESARRQASAEQLVAQRGATGSVFGRRHNDHVWLEVQAQNGDWTPADPSVGVVGTVEWIRARVALNDRTKPPVVAVAAIVREMIAPIAVFVRGGDPEDRTERYLVDAFNDAYGGRLASLPAWPEWVRRVRAFGELARGAFQGQVNLHAHATAIDELAAIYSSLQQQGVALQPLR
jgi:hypothetical protein